MNALIIKKVPPFIYGLFAILLFALSISGTPLRVALISSSFIIFQIFVGGLFFVAIVDEADLTWQEFCAMGLVFGSLVTVALDQIFRKTTFADFAWALSLLAFFWLRKSKPLFANFETQDQKILGADLLLILSAGLLFVASDWFWALPVAGFFVAMVSWFEFVDHRRIATIAAIICALVSGFTIFTRPDGWWVEDSDLALNEAISQTLKVWGTQENINAVGSPTRYHWLVYGWSGLLERVSDSPNWVMNSRVIPLVVSVGTALLIWSILWRLGYSKKIVFASLLIIGTYDTVPTWGRGFGIGYTPSPSQMYGLLLLLGFVYLVIIFDGSLSKKSVVLFLIVGIGAIGAKVPHGAIVAASAGLSILSLFLKTKKVFSINVIRHAAVILGSILGFILIIGGLSDSSRGMIIDQVAFVNGITGDFRAYSIQIRWLAALIFIFGFYAVPILGLAQVKGLKTLENQSLRTLLFGGAISGLLGAMFLSGEFAVELFFVHASSSLMMVFVAPLFCSQITKLNISKRATYLVLGTGLFSAVISAFIPNLNSGSTSAIALRLAPSLIGLLPIGVATLIALKLGAKPKSLSAVSQLALTGLVAMSIGFFAVNFSRNAANEYPEFERNYESRVGLDKPDLIAASNWITANTRVSAIFATNDFCDEISPDCNPKTDWLKRVEYSMKCTRDEVLRWVGTDNCNPGGYKLLTALVDRRFLAGNFWVGVSDGAALQPWLAERVMNSVNFAKSPTSANKNALVDLNVEWFLLRKSLTESQDWQNFGTVEYSNDSYAIIKLD